MTTVRKGNLFRNYPNSLTSKIDRSRIECKSDQKPSNITRNISDALFSSDLRTHVHNFNIFDSTKDCGVQEMKIPLKSMKQYNPLIDKEQIITRPDIVVESRASNYSNQYNRLLSHNGMFHKKIGYFTYAQSQGRNILKEHIRNGQPYIQKEKPKEPAEPCPRDPYRNIGDHSFILTRSNQTNNNYIRNSKSQMSHLESSSSGGLTSTMMTAAGS